MSWIWASIVCPLLTLQNNNNVFSPYHILQQLAVKVQFVNHLILYIISEVTVFASNMFFPVLKVSSKLSERSFFSIFSNRIYSANAVSGKILNCKIMRVQIRLCRVLVGNVYAYCFKMNGKRCSSKRSFTRRRPFDVIKVMRLTWRWPCGWEVFSHNLIVGLPRRHAAAAAKSHARASVSEFRPFNAVTESPKLTISGPNVHIDATLHLIEISRSTDRRQIL